MPGGPASRTGIRLGTQFAAGCRCRCRRPGAAGSTGCPLGRVTGAGRPGRPVRAVPVGRGGGGRVPAASMPAWVIWNRCGPGVWVACPAAVIRLRGLEYGAGGAGTDRGGDLADLERGVGVGGEERGDLAVELTGPQPGIGRGGGGVGIGHGFSRGAGPRHHPRGWRAGGDSGARPATAEPFDRLRVGRGSGPARGEGLCAWAGARPGTACGAGTGRRVGVSGGGLGGVVVGGEGEGVGGPVGQFEVAPRGRW